MTSQHSDDAPAFTSKDKAVRREATDGGQASVSGVAVTIDRPRHELFAYYRDFANLARFMENVQSIDVIDDKRSHWKVHGPTGSYEWNAVVTQEVDGELIAWKTEPGADVESSGSVRFADANPGRGTVVTATIGYTPPGGIVGKLVAKVTQKEPSIQARRDLRRFKQLMETGEIATSSPPNPQPKS